MTGPYDELDFDQANDLVRQRQRFYRRPKRSADILGHLMARRGYGQTETAKQLEETWNEIVGPKWKMETRVGTIRQGVLEVMVSSSVVNQQLGFKKKQLLFELQVRLPQNNLKDLRFRLGNVR